MTASIMPGRLRVLGTGQALPGLPVSTGDLLGRISNHFAQPTRTGTALARRLGVSHRHFSRDFSQRFETPRAGARNPDLAVAALRGALQECGIAVADLQYLIGHTATPARPLPPNIAEVAAQLGHARPYAELRQACTGFANAVQWAFSMLKGPSQAPVAIVGSEVGSVFLDPSCLSIDRDQWVNLMQMGDGAGAIILGADDGSPGPFLESAFFGHIGLGKSSGFMLNDGGSDHPAIRDGRSSASFRQDFEAVKREGAALFHAGLAAAEQAGVDLAAMRWILPHQANGHIGAWLSRELHIPEQRFYVNADHVGNLGSAAIWVALHELRQSGWLRSGDRVLILGAEATQYLYGGFVYVHA